MGENPIRVEAERLAPEMVAWRRQLHRHPELGFQEVKTAAFVAERLRSLGLEVETGVARTGVVGVLRAKSPAGPPVLLRADLDALPIQETPGREYGSEIPGRMHACGHDGHMAMLIGAAVLLTSRIGDLRRDVVFCFQPAEEGQGGARRMIEEGVLQRTGAASAYAIHLWSPTPAGTVQVRSGPVMAAQDEFAARFVGRGGHGALPQHAVDPIVAAAHGLIALQTVVSREVDPVAPAVVSVGSIHGGGAPNVIPEIVEIEGTMRSFTENVRRTLRERVPGVLRGASEAHRCRLEFELREGYPPAVNDPAAVERVRTIAQEVVGSENVTEPFPMAASEDFAYFLEKVPGAFIFLGAGNEDAGITAPHHSPEFDIDESVLPVGAEFLTRLALHAL